MIQISADIKSIERELSALSAAKTVAQRHASIAETGSIEQADSRSKSPLVEELLDPNFEANPSKGLKDVRKNLLSVYNSEAMRAVSAQQQSGPSTNSEGAFQKRKFDGTEEHASAPASANPICIGECDLTNSLEDCSGGLVHGRIPKFQADQTSATKTAARLPSPAALCEGEDDPMIIHGGNADGGEEVDLARYAHVVKHNRQVLKPIFNFRF